jgi:hypothetical protein
MQQIKRYLRIHCEHTEGMKMRINSFSTLELVQEFNLDLQKLIDAETHFCHLDDGQVDIGSDVRQRIQSTVKSSKEYIQSFLKELAEKVNKSI